MTIKISNLQEAKTKVRRCRSNPIDSSILYFEKW